MNSDDRKAVLKTFLIESEERLYELEESMVHLESFPGDGETLDKIFRGVHTLKGNSLCLEFQGLSDFLHEIENLLQSLRNQTVPVTVSIITLLLQAVDMLRHMIPDSVSGMFELQPAHSELLKQIAEAGQPARGENEQEKPAPPHPAAVEKRKRPWGRRREDIHDLVDRTRSVRVDIDKLDRLLNLMGEITISQGRIKDVLRKNVGNPVSGLFDLYMDTDPLFMELQDQIMKLRLVPVGPTLRQFIRTVRDIARAHGKIARLMIEGEDVEIDTTFIEHLRDPLTHMIRNAIDHGIELPEQRSAKGKNPSGRITLRVFHDSGNIVIQIEDDGAGLQKEAILRKAVASGLARENQKLTDAEIYKFVFKPGFSTAGTVTDLSGRGMGMDVVQKNIDSLRGTIEIKTEEEKGSTFTLRLPLTMAIINGFAVGVAEEVYILPLEAVIECQDAIEIERTGWDGKGILPLRGKAVPYYSLRDLFMLGGSPPVKEKIVVVQNHEIRAGLAVDTVYGEVHAVIKPLGMLFKELPCIAGSTILGNGRVGLILDVASLLREMKRREDLLQNRSLREKMNV